jgi:hypothetical protein
MFERWKKIFGLPKAATQIQGLDELPHYIRATDLAVHASAAVDQGCTYEAWRCDPDGEPWLRLVHAGECSEQAVEPELLEESEFDELLEPRVDLSADELTARFHERMLQREDFSDDDEFQFSESDDDFPDCDYEA